MAFLTNGMSVWASIINLSTPSSLSFPSFKILTIKEPPIPAMMMVSMSSFIWLMPSLRESEHLFSKEAAVTAASMRL